MVQTRFALILYFCMVARKAHAILVKGLLKSMKAYSLHDVGDAFYRILWLEICAMVFPPAQSRACFSAIIFSAWGSSFLSMTLA